MLQLQTTPEFGTFSALPVLSFIKAARQEEKTARLRSEYLIGSGKADFPITIHLLLTKIPLGWMEESLPAAGCLSGGDCLHGFTSLGPGQHTAQSPKQGALSTLTNTNTHLCFIISHSLFEMTQVVFKSQSERSTIQPHADLKSSRAHAGKDKSPNSFLILTSCFRVFCSHCVLRESALVPLFPNKQFQHSHQQPPNQPLQFFLALNLQALKLALAVPPGKETLSLIKHYSKKKTQQLLFQALPTLFCWMLLPALKKEHRRTSPALPAAPLLSCLETPTLRNPSIHS